MRRYRRIVSLLIVMLFTVCMMAQPVLAAFDDVSEDSWYSDSVEYVFLTGCLRVCPIRNLTLRLP